MRMRKISQWIFWVTCCITLLCVFSRPSLMADEKTTLTFSAPVEIPGKVLPAGTYVFKLLDSPSNRHIVQAFNADETQLHGTFLAIPNQRVKPTDKPVIYFEERAAGAPLAIKAWFYPGDLYGHEFVYPRGKATELAKANKQPVLSMPEGMPANITESVKTGKDPQVVTLREARIKAITPENVEIEISEVVTAPPAKKDSKSPPP